MIIEWLMDEKSGCGVYLAGTLPLISANFTSFVDECSDSLDTVMSFLIRLSLAAEEEHPEITEHITTVEEVYEAYLGHASDVDTLSQTLAALVAYSDSSSSDSEQ